MRKDDKLGTIGGSGGMMKRDLGDEVALNAQAPPGQHMQQQMGAGYALRIFGKGMHKPSELLKSGTKNLD